MTNETTTPTEEFVRHNHNDGRALPFGRKMPAGQCPRCDQLLAGATPREAHPALQAVKKRERDDEQTRAAMAEHFAPHGPHARGDCGPVCTRFDW
jgi:hypothetical protein